MRIIFMRKSFDYTWLINWTFVIRVNDCSCALNITLVQHGFACVTQQEAALHMPQPPESSFCDAQKSAALIVIEHNEGWRQDCPQFNKLDVLIVPRGEKERAQLYKSVHFSVQNCCDIGNPRNKTCNRNVIVMCQSLEETVHVTRYKR